MYDFFVQEFILNRFVYIVSRIVTEKPHQGSVNKVLYCIVLYCNLVSVLAEETLSNFDKRNNNYVHWTWMKVYISLYCSNLSVARIH